MKEIKVEIKNEFPPNYEQIKKVFELHKGIIFTYGNTIYNPDNAYIDRPLLEHEKVHIKQQGWNVRKWWKKYLSDENFRLNQEIEAYQKQYEVAESLYNRNDLFNLLKSMAFDLSGEMYGNIISYQEAIRKIKNI